MDTLGHIKSITKQLKWDDKRAEFSSILNLIPNGSTLILIPY